MPQVMLPPNARGTVTYIAPAGHYTVDDEVRRRPLRAAAGDAHTGFLFCFDSQPSQPPAAQPEKRIN